MMKITVMTFGLLLAATPAFAHDDQSATAGVQVSGTAVIQEEINNTVGNASYDSYTNVVNGGVSNVVVGGSAGIINQNVNSGVSSNVGSATNVAITGGTSLRGGNIDAGNSNDGSTQIAGASLEQINVGNVSGEAAGCAANSAFTAGVANVAVANSSGIISQQINAGLTSNVGSAVGVTIH